MQELSKTYSPEGIENKWYDIWLKNNCFKPVKKAKSKPYTIVMPPPNVTGKLHMGHALDNSTQDALIRFKRMKGYEALWIPGTDHAGIATQAVVEKKIYKEEKKTKHDLGRDEFLKRIWAWKNEYGGHIKEQLTKLGVSCDWDYYTFTMDEVPNKSVRQFFVDMFNQGLIYQSDYIVNWDPILQSAISDAEVEMKEVKGAFYHIHYKVKDHKDVLTVATTRPETMFGDTAVAVNPNDDRFEHLIGKTAIIPLCNREVPIIADEHVDMEMGTGCLKVTPGHDFNDFEIGKRNNLPIINILNKNGTFNENAPLIQGMKAKEARKKVVELLTESGALIETKDHIHQVGHGQRSDEIVEPMVSKQWFLNTEKMAQRALEYVEKGQTTFYPKNWENTYFSWLKNPKPWCISRQLWWGHQIPVYTCNDCHHTFAKVDEPSECPKCKSHSLNQDPDVLDTWFSSGLFPLNTLGWPDKKVMEEKGFQNFYPTTTLVTGNDIIFFWVARMMMMCSEVTGKPPFKDVYIHAIVRDKNGIKMSKSLGNVIDPLEIINQYGCDALRFTLLASSGYNQAINLDPEKIEGYRNFMNKVWNAFRFISPSLELAQETITSVDKLHHHEKWILSELNSVTRNMNESIEIYRFDDAGSAIYSFVYDKFCSWFIELSKNVLNGTNETAKVQRATVLKYCFKQIMKLMHPFTPFLTEEIWSLLKSEKEGLLILETYPEYQLKFNFSDVQDSMNKFIELTTVIRNLRAQVNIKPKDEIDVKLFTDDENLARYFYQNRVYLKDLAKVKSGTIKRKKEDKPNKSIMQATAHTEVFIPLEGLIDMNEHIERLKKDMEKTKSELEKVAGKLKNPSFVDRAPKEVVEEVKAKAHEFKEKIKSMEVMIESFQ
jgi:valyl-tRNA synthetase